MKSITIKGHLRTETGKAATRLIRSQGNVPGVMYGGDKEISFYAPTSAFKHLVYTASFQLAYLELDGKTYKCIMKDLQFDKITDALTHIDLLELVEGKKVIASIPLKFVGTSVGVRAGGKFVPKINMLKVKTLPKYLVEAIEVKIDNLKINENIRVQDVKVDEFEFLNPARIPIASVVMTRQLKQEEAAAAPSKKK